MDDGETVSYVPVCFRTTNYVRFQISRFVYMTSSTPPPLHTSFTAVLVCRFS